MSTYAYHDAWLLPFLSAIRGWPGQFLNDQTVKTLGTYIRAYVQAREDLGAPPYGDDESELLAEFDEWLVKRLNLGKVPAAPGYAWPHYIEAVDASSNNVRSFFRLFEEFLVGKGREFLDPDDAASKWPAHPWLISGPAADRRSQ